MTDLNLLVVEGNLPNENQNLSIALTNADIIKTNFFSVGNVFKGQYYE